MLQHPSDRVRFRVARLSATAPEGVPVDWQGETFSSGPLFIELDDAPGAGESRGVLDYAGSRARACFHVRVRFPELAEMLESIGVDPDLTRPVRAVLYSEGDILPDHGFALSGACDLRPHGLFPPEGSGAGVLPGY